MGRPISGCAGSCEDCRALLTAILGDVVNRPLIVVVLVGLGAIVATAAPAHLGEAAAGCNVRLEGLKTFSDPQRNLVNLHPKDTSMPAPT
jgi:hypothetical protein